MTYKACSECKAEIARMLSNVKLQGRIQAETEELNMTMSLASDMVKDEKSYLKESHCISRLHGFGLDIPAITPEKYPAYLKDWEMAIERILCETMGLRDENGKVMPPTLTAEDVATILAKLRKAYRKEVKA